MRCRLACALVMVVGLVVTGGVVRAQEPEFSRHSGSSHTVETLNHTVRVSLDRIAARSASWRAAVAAVEEAGRRVVILTPNQVVVVDSRSGQRTGAFDPAVLAEVGHVPGDGAEVHTVLVVVNLELLERVHQSRRSLPAEQDADLDRILIHEVYGHAIPYLLAGSEAGRCADPVFGQRPQEACSIQRENVVRKEMGLGLRADSGVASLALARMD